MKLNVTFEQVGKWEAFVNRHEDTGKVNVYYAGNGGAMVTEDNEKLAKESFIIAMTELERKTGKVLKFSHTGKH